MELNFDKEMDALLRQTARQEKSAPPAAGMHLDADELAAFAAGGLPLKARARAVEHLTDCGNCRTTVANLVFFENQAAESSSVAAAPAVETASLLDRLKGFFTISTLAYGMAGLVLLVFAGMFTVMFYRNNSGGPEMAQSSPSKMERLSTLKDTASEGGEVSNQEGLAMMEANSNSAPMASAANAATGGAITMPAPAFGPRSANTSANSYTCQDCGSPADEERSDAPKLSDKKEAEIKKDSVVLDGLKAEPPPPPAAQEAPLNRSQTVEQNVRSLENNLRQNYNMMPDGGNDKDRKRAVGTEAGANISLDAADRDERQKQAAPPPPPAATKSVTTGKPVKKSSKKKAADPKATPAAETPKEKPEEEHPPCK